MTLTHDTCPHCGRARFLAIPCCEQAGRIHGRVLNAGGGVVEILVDRDTMEYPEIGKHVSICETDRTIVLTMPKRTWRMRLTDARIWVWWHLRGRRETS